MKKLHISTAKLQLEKMLNRVTCYSCFLAFHNKCAKLISKKSIKSTEHFICKLYQNNLFPFHNLAQEEFLLELGMVSQYSLNAEDLNKIFLKPEKEAESDLEISHLLHADEQYVEISSTNCLAFNISLPYFPDYKAHEKSLNFV